MCVCGTVQVEYSVPDGRVFVAGMLDERPHGRGSVSFPDGCRVSGVFDAGDLHGACELTVPGDPEVHACQYRRGVAYDGYACVGVDMV